MKTAYKSCLLATTLCSAFLFGCSTVEVHPGPALQSTKQWLLLPVLNLSDTPKAGDNVRMLLSNTLREPGLPAVTSYVEKSAGDELPELNEQNREDQAIAWGKERGFAYAVGGAVNEWRYKPGTGEPVIGVTLKVVDVQNGHVIWSASGSRSGWAGSTASGTARKLLERMVSEINLD
jgi:hypothetical protein